MRRWLTPLFLLCGLTQASAQGAVCIVVNGACVSSSNPLPTTSGGAASTNITEWASGILGAMANYGTSPGAVLVPGMNVFVTNPVAVTGALASFVDGSIATLGTEADTAWSSGSGTLIAISKASANSLATIAGAITSSVLQANLKQVNGVTTSTGAGAVGTGSQRVAVGQDATTIAGANPGRTYNTIAASQTAQALTGGGGGATGDYLAFCVVFPTTVSPGVVTIKDNTTTIDAFPGGTSSLSNLVPFSIPIGAVSVSGAWTVTTGAGLSVTCAGKFT